jgi:hypothetical protein
MFVHLPPEPSTQVVVVTSRRWASQMAVLRRFESRDGRWVQRGPDIPAWVGRNGFAPAQRRLQNTGQTPAGLFTIPQAFGAGRATPALTTFYRRPVPRVPVGVPTVSGRSDWSTMADSIATPPCSGTTCLRASFRSRTGSGERLARPERPRAAASSYMFPATVRRPGAWRSRCARCEPPCVGCDRRRTQ